VGDRAINGEWPLVAGPLSYKKGNGQDAVIGHRRGCRIYYALGSLLGTNGTTGLFPAGQTASDSDAQADESTVTRVDKHVEVYNCPTDPGKTRPSLALSIPRQLPTAVEIREMARGGMVAAPVRAEGARRNKARPFQ